jgi:Uma2 family endonuclease
MSTSMVKTPPRIGLESAGISMTPEEFDAITDYDDRYRYELIHGVLVATPFASIFERDPNEDLGYLLRLYREQHPQGVSLDATIGEEYITTTPDTRRRADRVIWAGLGRVPDLGSDVPTIVVEFVSPGKRAWRRDYEEKRREYLAIGVVEYWIIDRFDRTMTVFRNRPGTEGERTIKDAEIYRTELLPGFDLPLARLLSAADQWKKRKSPRKTKE